jgi:hypothetical protein
MEWVKVGETGSDFASSTFFVRPIDSPVGNEHWFLLYGNTIGDTGVRLRMQIVSYNGATLRTVWQKAELVRTYVQQVRGNLVELTSTVNDAEGHEVGIKEQWEVVSGGLKRVGKESARP